MPNYRPAGDSDSYSDDEGFSFDTDLENKAKVTEYAGVSNGDIKGEVESEPWRTSAFDCYESNHDVKSTMSILDKFREALITGDIEQVEKSLDIDKVDINHCFTGMTSTGTPLNIAISKGHAHLVEYLLNKNASLEQDETGGSPFMSIFQVVDPFACDIESKLLECAKIFLKLRPNEINVNETQNQRTTPLMFAAKEGYGKLVQFLVDSGADINLQDTQYWTALCFAADSGHGHVARILLENGANPDLPTRDGMFAVDLAGARSMDKLQSVIAGFTKRESKLGRQHFIPEGTITTFSEMDNILLGLDLQHLRETFSNNNIDLEIFLGLSETELVEIGITEIGSRKKILNAIAEIHKKDWEKTSIPKISPKDKLRGLNFTAPDCVAIAANLAEHVKFMSGNISYMTRQLDEHPELLKYGQEIAGVKPLHNYVKKCQRNVKDMTWNLKVLEKKVASLASQDKYQPTDLTRAKANGRNSLSKWFCSAIVVGVISVMCYKILT